MEFLAVGNVKSGLSLHVVAGQIRRFLKPLDVGRMLPGSNNLTCSIEKSHPYRLLDL